MGTAYEKTYRVTTTEADEIVALDFPGRCVLQKLVVVREGDGAIAVDLFNRAFTSEAVDIQRITSADGNTRLEFATALKLAVGDVITVAATGVGGYNTSHRVTEVIDNLTVVTDQSFTSEVRTGTATLAIPTAEQEIYRIMTQLTGTDNASSFASHVVVNQDPQGQHGIGYVRKIYVQFATAATYRLALGCDIDTLGGG